MSIQGFRMLQTRAVAMARAHIRDGQFTERGLARHLGISQPHMHNVLCGARAVTPQLLEALLRGFRMSLLDLFTTEELEQHLHVRKQTRG